MKSRYQSIFVLIAVLVITGLQVPSSARMTESLSMANGMTKVQIHQLSDSMSRAVSHVTVVFSKAYDSGKAQITESTLTHSERLSVDARYACTGGGYVDSTMSSTAVLTKSTGNLTVTVSLRQTLSNWKCVAGWIVNGKLFVTYKESGSSTGEFSSTNGTMSGTWKSTGPKNAKQSCQIKGSVQEGAVGAKPIVTDRITCVPGGVTVITENL